jgi:HEAT repeat protein
MDKNSTTDVTSGPTSPPAEKGKNRPLQASMRAIIMLIVCCAAIFWAYRSVWESYHPLKAAAGKLTSGSTAQHLAAIRQLTELGTGDSAEAVRALVPALHDQDETVRAEAAQAIGAVGSYAARSDPETIGLAIKGLLESLSDTKPAVRIAVISALRILSGSSLGEPQRETRKAAAASKSSASTVDVAPVSEAFLKLLGDPDPEVQRAAIGALATIGPRALGTPPRALFEVVENPSAVIRVGAISALAGFPRGLDPLVPALLKHLEHDEPEVRDACAQALGRIRPSALSSAVAPDLVAGLKSPDRDVRTRIIALISRLSPDVGQVAPALIAVLHEPVSSDGTTFGPGMIPSHVGPAHEAARALGQLAPGTKSADAAIKALTEVLESGPDQRKATAATALGRFGQAAAEAVPALIKRLQETAGQTEPGGPGPSNASTLADISPGTPYADKAVVALTAALRSAWSPTREAAIHALSKFGPAATPALPALRELKEKDPVPNVREAAEATLSALKDAKSS